MFEAEAPPVSAQRRLRQPHAQLARSRCSAPAAVHYPESDGKPMAETGRHWQATVDVVKPLHIFLLSGTGRSAGP